MGSRDSFPTQVRQTDTATQPSRPTWLVGEARAEWNRTTAELARSGRLTATDRAVLIAHCAAWARFVEAERALGDSYVAVGSRGQSVASAEFGVWRALHERVVTTSAALGLHVAARLRLPPAVSPPFRDSEWDAIDRMGQAS